MNIFIDTNIFLNIYHFSDDDITELEKLLTLIETETIQLITTKQLNDEFLRNRESKILEAINTFNSQKLDKGFPQIVRHYPEFEALNNYFKEFNKTKKEITDKLRQDGENNNFKADGLITKLFESSRNLNEDIKLIRNAKLRFDLGNPPGKKKSYGDAVNWEHLLGLLPDGQDLVIISDDGDFQSDLDEKKFNPFLKREWQMKKSSSILFYNSLTNFFKDHFPDILLNDEFKKDKLIEKLAASGSFNSTHNNLAYLSQYSDFTKIQLENILNAALSNSQIYWISDDNDVQEILGDIVTKNIAKIDDDLLESFNSKYKTEYKKT